MLAHERESCSVVVEFIGGYLPEALRNVAGATGGAQPASVCVFVASRTLGVSHRLEPRRGSEFLTVAKDAPGYEMACVAFDVGVLARQREA